MSRQGRQVKVERCKVQWPQSLAQSEDNGWRQRGRAGDVRDGELKECDGRVEGLVGEE